MALPRDYNVLLWDGPGQGGMLYQQRVTMRPDFETVVRQVIDWLLIQEGVDAEALVLVGRSLAGYLAPRAAAYEERLAALICDPGQVEFLSRIVPSMFDGKTWQGILSGDPVLDAKLQHLLDDPHRREWIGARMATMGAATVGDFLRTQVHYTIEKQANRIACPTLVTEGEGDFASQSRKLFELLTCEKQFVRLAEKDGAGGHCCGLGQTLWEEAVFSWLDGILGRVKGS
jgi:pimeloyl-ACP methyl ester carboxylesterase